MGKEQDPIIRTMKYLVGYNFEKRLFQVGYTREWKWHQDIYATFEEGYKPRHGGLFTIELEGPLLHWKTDSLVLHGMSEGFNIHPYPQKDMVMLKKMLQDENTGGYTVFFTRDLTPAP